MKNKGEVATIFVVTSCVIVGLLFSALKSGKVQAPDFSAKPKTVDTIDNPAPPEWDR